MSRNRNKRSLSVVKSTTTTTNSTKNKKLKPDKLDKFLKEFEIIKYLRADRTAPVDTMGGEAIPDKEAGEDAFHFQVLICLMLSSMTKDQQVYKAMTKLKQELKPFNLETVLNTSEDEIKSLISNVGFFNRKASYIKKASAIIKEKHGGKVPRTSKEIIDLPGIGPKMGFLILQIAFDIHEGIGVDVHLARISNQLSWVNKNTKKPEAVRLELEEYVPQDYWHAINYEVVGLGQMITQDKLNLLQRCISYKEPKEAFSLMRKIKFDYKRVAKENEITL